MTASSYKLRFWGTRGTVPTPSAEQLRYGGNTSCVAIDLGDHEHLILDCGTGLRLLGNELAKRPASRRYHIFLSHYHLDHVMGLPFFQPLYDPSSTITFHGFTPEGHSLGDTLGGLMSSPYFPVRLQDVPAKVEYIRAGRDRVQIRDVTIDSLHLNHPDECLSYRLEHGARRLIYATDHEHGDEKVDRALVQFAEGADYLIYDATYQEAEYESLRRGWGHSTWYAAVQAALAARVKMLILFHHHPEHTDDELDQVLSLAREELPTTEIAAEGMELPF